MLTKNRKTALDIKSQHLILKRAIITILITVVYIVLTEIPLPFIHLRPLVTLIENPNMQSFQLLSMLGGGNLTQMSILLIGYMPYITCQLSCNC